MFSLPTEKSDKYISDLTRVLSKKSISQRELLTHIGRTRHMASIYRPLAAFARNLECWAYSVKKLSHHVRLSKPLKNDIQLCIWGINQASKFGISFDQFLKPMHIPDIKLYTDASLKIGLGGYTDDGKWFQNKWDDINLFHPNNRDIVWRELTAIFSFIHALRFSLQHKVVHAFTDNEACKYMLINMRSKLTRPDLQLVINEICKILIEFGIILWMEHIPGKENIIPDSLSRYKPIPSHLIHNCYNQIDTTQSLQLASNICKNVIINIKHLQLEDI